MTSLAASLCTALAFAGLLAPGSAVAASGAPVGNFGGAGGGACLISPQGFNDRLQPNDPTQTWSASENNLLLLVFNGDGTGTISGEGTSVIPPPTPGFAPHSNGFKTTGSFTYDIGSHHGNLNIAVSDVTGLVIGGPRDGQTFTIDAYALKGVSNNSGKTLAVTIATPTVETITYSNGDVFQRLCHRSAQLQRQTS